MQQDHENDLPAYKRIQNVILKRMESGVLRAGDAIDSERQLAKVHQVSLMTARHALAGLEREGVVVRRRGAGTFVAPPKIHFNKLMSFTEQMAVRNLPARSKILSCTVTEEESEVAARLALPPGSRLIRLERLREGAGEPFALETCYLSEEEFPRLRHAPLERGSLFSILESEYGLELAQSDEEIDATNADARTAQLLAIGKGQPLLRIRQVIYSAKGRATVYVRGFYRSDRHNLLIRRFR
jgi:GntR family transcriptional regulator